MFAADVEVSCLPYYRLHTVSSFVLLFITDIDELLSSSFTHLGAYDTPCQFYFISTHSTVLWCSWHFITYELMIKHNAHCIAVFTGTLLIHCQSYSNFGQRWRQALCQGKGFIRISYDQHSCSWSIHNSVSSMNINYSLLLLLVNVIYHLDKNVKINVKPKNNEMITPKAHI